MFTPRASFPPRAAAVLRRHHLKPRPGADRPEQRTSAGCRTSRRPARNGSVRLGEDLSRLRSAGGGVRLLGDGSPSGTGLAAACTAAVFDQSIQLRPVSWMPAKPLPGTKASRLWSCPPSPICTPRTACRHVCGTPQACSRDRANHPDVVQRPATGHVYCPCGKAQLLMAIAHHLGTVPSQPVSVRRQLQPEPTISAGRGGELPTRRIAGDYRSWQRYR